MHTLNTEISQLALPAQLAQTESVLTVGAFDGIHLGHRDLIQKMVERAREKRYLSGLVTFTPHPITVLRPQEPFYYLTTPGDKESLLAPLGLDVLVLLRFDLRLANMPPRAFVQRLCERMGMRELWIGPDFALGQSRQGDPARLRALGRELGFEVHDVPRVAQDQERVSSSAIRALLQAGEAAQAARLLGRYYAVTGEVVHGAQRGHKLGFPTANIAVAPDRALPADGVYATYAYLGTECFPSVTNVGVRPTFDNGARSVEAYLLDTDRDIYGRELTVAFVERLRPELRFDNLQDLIAQIQGDVKHARRILRDHSHTATDTSKGLSKGIEPCSSI
jgi:riboflavin kinase/FMN adenylyltransferase